MVFSPPSTSKDCTFSLNKLSRTILILFSEGFSLNVWKIIGFFFDTFRDDDNGAIVNTDRSAYLAYKAKKQQRLNEMGRIDKLQNEIDEIKSLLYKVIDKL